MKKIRELISYVISQPIGFINAVFDAVIIIVSGPVFYNFYFPTNNGDVVWMLVGLTVYPLLAIRLKRNIQMNKEVIKQKISEFWTAIDIKTLAMTCLVLTATFLIAIIMPMANILCLVFVIILGSCSSAMVVLSMRIFKYNKEISTLEKELRIGEENIKRYESEIAVIEQNLRMYNEQIRQLNQFKQQDER